MSAPHMPMMNEKGLLECNSCGSLMAYSFSTPRNWWIECIECGCHSDAYFKLDSAIIDWNTRNGHLYTAEDFNQTALERE